MLIFAPTCPTLIGRDIVAIAEAYQHATTTSIITGTWRRAGLIPYREAALTSRSGSEEKFQQYQERERRTHYGTLITETVLRGEEGMYTPHEHRSSLGPLTVSQ